MLSLVLCINCFSNYAQQTVGVFTHTAEAEDGYVLFAPIVSDSTYLIDKCGRRIHTWHANLQPGLSAYLLQDGTLLRSGSVGNPIFNQGGTGGRITRFDWNSNILWTYLLSDDTECQHHDMCYLPNGNILVIMWESKTAAQMLQAGRNPNISNNTFWPEKIVELAPSGTNQATIVWQWHVWDHVVQDYDATKDNYGTVAAHPELVDLNLFPLQPAASGDWLHVNGIDYNPALDQIMLSVHNLGEIWIIDHSTTTAEAAGHSGGARGKGGDLLYRWGNPQNYGAGTPADQQLFVQHDAQWIKPGIPDSGKILIFNNGTGRPGGNYSSVDMINPPVENGVYLLAGQAYGPAAPDWSYTAPTPTDFYANIISGAQKIANGNVLICSGPQGEFFEVDSNKNLAWKYISPVTALGIISQDSIPQKNSVFRSPEYAPDYPGLAGHSLTPGAPIEHNPLPDICALGVNVLTNSASGSVTAVNPFDDKITLQSWENAPNSFITLTDITGRVMQQWQNIGLAAGGTVSLPLSNGLPSGMYILTIKNVAVLKLLKQ